MSTTRHRRRTWQQIGTRAATGVVLGADAVWTIHADNGVLVLATLAFGVTAAALIMTACSWTASTVWHRSRGRYLVQAVAHTPLRRPLYPINSAQRNEPPAEPGLHYAINADHWRHDAPPEPDPVRGPRPYVQPASDPADATVGAAR